MRTMVVVTLLTLIVLGAIQAQTPAVEISLMVSDGSGGTQQLRFGLDPTATDGIDASLGESELAPIPSSGVFDARFVGDDIGLSLGRGILKDYRQGSATMVGTKAYEIRYQVGTGTSIVLSWNLPSGVTGRLQDIIAGTYLDQAMNGTGTYTITSPGVFSKLKMTIGYGVIAPPVPTLISPSDSSTGIVTSPYVSWAPSSGATSYHLQATTDQSFGILDYEQNNIAGTVHQISGLKKTTLYYWRVSASNVAGASAYSAFWRFTTVADLPDTPDLLLPADNAMNVAINTVLSWSPSAGATSYRLQVATDPAFGSITLDNYSIVVTSWQLGPLLNSTIYYWRVSASNLAGSSALSPTRSFATIAPATAPQAPVPNSPRDGQVNVPTSLTLNWNPSIGATSYQVQVSSTSNFTSLFVDDPSLSNTSRQVRSLANSTIYYWRVRARNEGGTSSYSPIMRFTTIDPGLVIPWQQTNGPSGGTVQCIATIGNALFAGMNGFGGISRSTDNGATWTAINSGLTSTDVRAIAVSGTNLFAGTYLAGVFLSTNNGASWRTVNSGLANPIVVSLFASGSSLFTGTSGGVFLSTNNGTSWTAVNSGLTDKFVNCFMASGSNLFAGSNGAGVYVSTDNGTSWTGTGPGNAVVYSFVLSGNTLFAGTSTGVYRSTDDGKSWSAAGMANVQVLSLAAAGSNLFAGTNGNGISVSTNSGTTWNAANAGLTDRTVKSLIVSGSNLYAGTNAAVFVSQIIGTPDTPTLDLPVNATQNVSIFLALSWNAVASARSYHLQLSLSGDFAFPVVDDSALTTTLRTVGPLLQGTTYYWRVRAGNEVGFSNFSASRQFSTTQVTSVDRSGNRIPREFGLGQNYPNPFNPSTIINYQLSVPGRVVLRVFNSIGQEVAVLVNEKKDAGVYSVRWDAQGAPSGIYFYRLQAGDRLETKKMIYLR